MTELIAKARRLIARAQESAPVVGWKWAIGDPILKWIGVEEVWLRVKGLDRRVACRINTSDIFEFSHLLGVRQVPFNFPIRPTFIVDAGANVGYSALRFQKEFPGAIIVALEPERGNITQFRKNCSPYSNITLEEAAVWGTSSQLTIRSHNARQNAYQVEESNTGDVKALSINDLMKLHRLPRIDLLKIDIEGSEKEVFSHPNVEDWLQYVGMILIEIHDLIEEGCGNAVQQALEGNFDFRGYIDEYAFYVSRKIGPTPNIQATSVGTTNQLCAN
jgi:FkbM family methyltransferase